MKLTKLLLSGCVLSLGVAVAASSHSVKILAPIWVGQTELKPGDYKIQVEGDKATLTMGKTMVEAPVKVETNSGKYSFTQFSTKSVDGKSQIEEIDLGGTKSKIVFGTASAPVPAGTK